MSRPIRDGEQKSETSKQVPTQRPTLPTAGGGGVLLCLLCLVGRVGGTYYTVLAVITVSAWPGGGGGGGGGGATLLPTSVSAVTACRRTESAHNLTGGWVQSLAYYRHPSSW